MNSATVDYLPPASLATAVEANMVAFLASMAGLSRVAFHQDAEAVRFITGIPHPLLNAVMRARFAPSEVDIRIDAELRHFTSRDLPMCWYTGPDTRPVDLSTHLEARGLMHAADMPGMALDLLALNQTDAGPADLQIEQVSGRATLEQWLRPLASGFDLPDIAAKGFGDLFAGIGFGPDAPFRHYLGRLRGVPVACSTLFLGSDVAGIYDVAVVPGVRRQGIGTAITLAPLRAARALGYRYAVLFATTIMSAEQLQKIVGRAVIESTYRDLLAHNPGQALAGYELTDDEIAVLKRFPFERLDTLAYTLETRIVSASYCGVDPTGSCKG